MTKVKFELEIDASEKEHVEALNVFLSAIGGQETAPAMEVSKPEAAEEKPKKKRRTKAEIDAEKTAKNDEAPKEEETGVKIDDVRKALGEVIQTKGDTARDKAAAKLKEFEAKNVSTLAPEHYQEFIDFLKSL